MTTWLVFLALAASARAQAPWKDLEIVESVPIESLLDIEEVRDTAYVWLEMIREAQSTLDIEQFYISNKTGTAMDMVLDEIEAAAMRGVKVRVIVDRGFTSKYKKPLARLAAIQGIETRTFEIGKLTGEGIQHAKYFIVDKTQVFLGSQNFDWRSLAHVREIGVRVRDPELASFYLRIFEYDWGLAGHETPRMAKDLLGAKRLFKPLTRTYNGDPVVLQPLASPEALSPYAHAGDLPRILETIAGAKKDVTIELLTYSPATHKKGETWRELDDALRAAAARGVKVRLLVSDWSKRWPIVNHIKELAGVQNFELRFITIPESSGGFIPFARVLHAKALTVDGRWSWIGSSNWERGYFYGSRNVGLWVDSPVFAKQLRALFDIDWNSPYVEKVDPKGFYRAPRIGP